MHDAAIDHKVIGAAKGQVGHDKFCRCSTWAELREQRFKLSGVRDVQ